MTMYKILQVACPKQADLYVQEYYNLLKQDLYSENGYKNESIFIAKHFDGNQDWYNRFCTNVYMNAKRSYNKKPKELSLEELKEVMN